MRRIVSAVSWTSLTLGASQAPGCPFCDSEIGCRVRAGIFGPEFAPNLLVTLLPFAIFLGLTACIHRGFRTRDAGGRT